MIKKLSVSFLESHFSFFASLTVALMSFCFFVFFFFYLTPGLTPTPFLETGNGTFRKDPSKGVKEIGKKNVNRKVKSFDTKPLAIRRNIVGKQLPTFLDITCSFRLHTLRQVVACCWELLCKVFETGLTFEPSNISFVP